MTVMSLSQRCPNCHALLPDHREGCQRGGPSTWVCSHRNTEPVESVTGETVAHLCLTCDTQLPA